MPHTLRPLTLGQLLDSTFDIYRRNFLLFVGISAIPNSILLLLQLSLGFAIGSKGTAVGSAVILPALLVGFASLFVSSIVEAATTFGVSDVYLDMPTSIRACFSRIAGKALRVVYVSFLVGLIVGLGFLLCIIPGIYWLGKYGIAIPAVVLEDITGGEALERSSSLTQGAVGRVIVVSLLTGVFTLAMAFALDLGMEVLESAVFHHAGMLTGDTVQAVTSTLVGILLGPVTAIALTLVYYDQRVRKEAFDIERLMSMLDPSKSLTSEASSS